MTQPTTPLPLPTQAADQIAGHDFANALAEWVNYLAGFLTVSLAAVVSQSGSLSVPNGPGTGTGPFNAGRTYATFDTIEYDPLGMINFSGTHGSQIITALQPGLYLPFASGSWANNGTGFRTLSVDLGGDAASVVIASQLPPVAGGTPTVQQVSGFKVLSAAATVALRADQNSGAALTLSGPRMALFRAALSS